MTAEITSATSYDPRYPPSAIIDGDAKTFWATTGLMPQEFVLRLPSKASLAKLKIRSANIKHLIIERCDGMSPFNWSAYIEQQELPDIDTVQEVVLTTPPFPVTFLKFKMQSSYVDFCFVYSVEWETRASA